MAMRGESRVNNKDIGTDNAASERPLHEAAFLSMWVGLMTAS